MVSAAIDTIMYKVVWYPRGDMTKSGILLKLVKNHESQENINFENNTVSLELNLDDNRVINVNDINYETHEFTDSSDGRIKLSTKDILQVFIKYELDGTDIDISSRDDLLADYFIKSWDIDMPNRKLKLNAVDINYRVFNRLWNGVYSTLYSSTASSIMGTTLTDASQSWEFDSLVNRTLQLEDADGKQYTYLIVSNTSNSVTVHNTIDSAVTNDYKIGFSSASAIINSLKGVINTKNYTGNYDMTLTTTTDIGDDYVRGVQLLRPDGSAFPIIDYALSRKPYYELLSELSSINAVNTEYELENLEYVIIRDMEYSVFYNTETGKYELKWYYLTSPSAYDTGVVTSVSGFKIYDTSKSYSANELINKLVRCNDKTYQIIANSATSLTLHEMIEYDITTSDTFTIINNAEFIWDSDKDFKHIKTYKFGNDDDSTFNHILFSCGTNPFNGIEITGHLINEDSNLVELKETYIPMTNIVRRIVTADGRHNGTDYEYPSYPHTINWPKAQEVNSDTEYNTELRRLCRLKAYEVCRTIFSKIKEGYLKGTIQVRGNKFVQVGETSNISKWYSKGSRILFKDIKNGIVNPLQPDGYFYLRVKSIRHAIDKFGWLTSLDVEWDLYSENETSDSLNL